MGTYDLGRDRTDRLRFRFATGEGRDPVLTYYVYYGPSHDAILDAYTAKTGRPFIPPLWAFKHWRWRDEHAPVAGELDGNVVNAEVAEDVRKYEELDFPVGNYMIDRPWTPGPEGFARFAWDETRFPNPGAMRQSLADRGYHLIVWGAPWAIGDEPGQLGYEADQNGYHAPGSRREIDFTNPDAFAWFKDHIVAFSRDNELGGWKLDRGEEDTPSFWWNIYHDGRNGIEMRNAFPLLYQKCYHDAMQEVRGDDFVNVYRSGFAGSQAWGIANGGDVRGATSEAIEDSIDTGLRSAIIMVQHAAFMGFPVWGSDTGGYQEFRDREVFARWIEFSCFTPIMEIGGIGAHAPWNMPTEPNYDPEVIDIYRAYTRLHHDLAEYIWETAQGSGQTGRPIVRPLVFDYPDDPAVKDLWDEYFFGPDILVAPIWKIGTRERSVYLPAGEFVDYWRPDRTVIGPSLQMESTPLDRIPIFIRRGAEVLGRVW
jgi:alpha-glucosidase (family GH31 glycosyl hydrolase)